MGAVTTTELGDDRMATGHPADTDATSPLPEGPLSQEEITRLIEEHLPLVNHVVFQVAVHFPRHVDRDELARAGALGLVEAARRYDEARGVPFNRFAAQRIRGAIIDGVRAADWAGALGRRRCASSSPQPISVACARPIGPGGAAACRSFPRPTVTKKSGVPADTGAGRVADTPFPAGVPRGIRGAKGGDDHEGGFDPLSAD